VVPENEKVRQNSLKIASSRYQPYYWTFSKIENFKVSKNLKVLGVKQKCPVVWILILSR
jgi:hypothetical protein